MAEREGFGSLVANYCAKIASRPLPRAGALFYVAVSAGYARA